jgi:hypothetical protein
MRHSAPTAQIRGVALGSDSKGSIDMGLAREWVDIFIHTLRILKQHGVAQVRNHADITQVFEFEGFFSA